MLSRTADHLFWMSRYIERAVLSAWADRARQRHNTGARASVPGFEA